MTISEIIAESEAKKETALMELLSEQLKVIKEIKTKLIKLGVSKGEIVRLGNGMLGYYQDVVAEDRLVYFLVTYYEDGGRKVSDSVDSIEGVYGRFEKISIPPTEYGKKMHVYSDLLEEIQKETIQKIKTALEKRGIIRGTKIKSNSFNCGVFDETRFGLGCIEHVVYSATRISGMPLLRFSCIAADPDSWEVVK